MPRARSPERDRAKEIWIQSGGEMPLKQIAADLGIGETLIRKWKSQDKWKDDLNGNVTNQLKGNVTKRKAPKQDPPPPVGPESDELTEKQQLFVIEYLRDFNATRAAMAGGYSKKTAYSIGWQLLRNVEVQDEIKRLKKLMAGELGISVQRVIAEYMKIAFTDITDVLEFGQKDEPLFTDDGPAIDPKTGEQITYKRNFVMFKDSGEIDGTVISEVKQGKDGVSIKLHDKMRALKELEKYLGFMTEEDRLRVNLLKAQVKAIGNSGDGNDQGGLDQLAEAIQKSAAAIRGEQ